MKRMLLVVAAALMFLNTIVVPSVVKADGGVGGTSCGSTGKGCKP